MVTAIVRGAFTPPIMGFVADSISILLGFLVPFVSLVYILFTAFVSLKNK